MLGCYGSPLKTPEFPSPTPHLDRLAAQGVRFERAYSVTPLCGPARAALFTGTYPHENGSWTNSLPLGDNVRTVGQRLQDAGVHTAYIGKWHLDGSDYFGLGRAPQGWDAEVWYDMRNYLEELPDEDRLRSRDPQTNDQPSVSAEFTFAKRCSDRALNFLRENHDRDFFLVVSYDEPHHPFLCPPPYARMYKAFDFPLPENASDSLENKPAHQQLWAQRAVELVGDRPARHPHFFGCNAFVDSQIGRVLAGIDQYAPGALVIYTADHGDMLGSHGLVSKGPAMYEEITHIPLIVRWPGHAPAGAIAPGIASHIGLTPTVLDYFDVERPPLLSGKSWLPTLHDPQVTVEARVFMEYARYEIDHDGFGGFQPIRACFDGRYKLVINLLSSDELYDLHRDPEEMHNVVESPEYSAIRDQLHDHILTWMNDTRDPFRGYQWERRPWRSDAPPAHFEHSGYTRQRQESERYEPRQLDYSTGLPMESATRKKFG